MLQKISLLILFFFNIANAITLEKVLELVEIKNAVLQSKQKGVEASKVDASLSDTWSNPIVGFGMSDINLNEPKKRDIEAMQTQFVTYTQTIPTNGKLALASDIKNSDTKIKQLELLDFKQKLKSQAMLYAFGINIQTKKMEILQRYIKNLHEQKDLMNLLYDNGKLDQSKLVTIDINIYKQKLIEQKLHYKISQMQSALENIIYQKVKSVEFSDTVTESILKRDNEFENHPLILILNEKILKQSQKIDLENRKKISDVKVSVGYYQRERFDDYMSFNVAIPLSIQGREKLAVKKSMVDKSALQDQLYGLKQQIKTTIDDLEQKANLSKYNYELIENKMIPLNDDLESSHKMHLSTNMMQSLEVYKTTNSKFELMLLAKDEKLNYFDAISKLYYFKGKL